ncbi:MAG TPA: N-6 DNA methylase, partial [Candidatus Limnocylindria bacterium]|nr:N-6 DNA methylase [Candidatus Limnocylindria bacterium]
LGEWDYRDDVPVTLLGHLFEQSITDLERLRAESRGEAAPKVSKRKREGVVYTPDIVTRFLVERTIGLTLSERFQALLTQHGKTMPDNGDPIFAEHEQATERAFWHDYAEALRTLRIVDPACGSGAFLVAAFDLLAAEYRRVVEHLAVLGEEIDFDPFDEIVTGNLYGVDLNAESVEITRLALWLKTARYQHQLQNLEATIKVGNSLIDDRKFTDHPFDWRAAFPEVFARGGFDVVIGNPPYVRMELIKPFKPYLEKHYVVADDRTDLYAYFFERGVGVLKDGGRLGYISSSTFFRTGSGENLRMFLGDRVAVEAVIDFGDLQIFEGVTTYPAIVTLRKGAADDGGVLAFLKVDALPKDLEAEFAARSQAMPRARLGTGSCQVANDALAKLRAKIVAGRRTLGEVYGAPAAGIKTGRNEAFVINQETSESLIRADAKSKSLIKTFAMGDSAYKWATVDRGTFLIYIRRDSIQITDYPAIRNHLLQFKKSLEKRALDQKWFELQQAQPGYEKFYQSPKIVFRDISDRPTFAFVAEELYIDMTCFCLPTDDLALLSLLNCRVSWFFWKNLTPELRGGFVRLKRQFVTQLPIPEMQPQVQAKLGLLGDVCTKLSRERSRIRSIVRHRIIDLAPPMSKILSRKLEEWWTLDFAAFRDEIKRAFHVEIPVKERSDWEAYLADNAAKVHALSAEIERAEREIDTIVYRLSFRPKKSRCWNHRLRGNTERR